MAITVDSKGLIKYIPTPTGPKYVGPTAPSASWPGPAIAWNQPQWENGGVIPQAPPATPVQSDWAGNPVGSPNYDPNNTGAAPGLDPTIRAYMDLAATYGYDFEMAQYQALLKGRVSVDDFAARLALIKRTEDQKSLLDAFGQVLAARGLVKDPNLTLQERLAFVSGKAPRVWMDVMDEFNVWADAIHAGLDPGGTGKYGISRELLLNVSKAYPGIGQEGQMVDAFAKVAQDFKYAIPMGKWTGFGISKADVVHAELGSDKPGQQVQIIDKMQRALATYQAAQQNRANPQFALTANGGAVFGYSGLGGTGTQ